MATITIVGSKDAHVRENTPDTNYDSIYLYIQKDTASGWIRRSFIEFDLSTLLDVPLEFINTVILQIRVLDVSDPITIDLQRIDNDTWTETGVTWNNQPTTTDYNIEEDYDTAGTTIQTSMKQMLLDAIIDGHSYLGISLKLLDEATVGLHYSELASSEYATTSYRPQLIITYDTYSQTLLYGSICKNLLMKSGWGEVTMTDHNCPSTCDAATFTFKTAWGSTYTTVLLDVGDTQQYDSGTMHHSFKLYSMTDDSAPCDHLAAATIEEKYWEDDCYVKTTGDNDKNGTDWTEAWSTVDQAANEAFDGQEVHIGFGTYNSEPASNDITPVNFGTTGIKYTPETAGTGGGTGIVTVERN